MDNLARKVFVEGFEVYFLLPLEKSLTSVPKTAEAKNNIDNVFSIFVAAYTKLKYFYRYRE